MPASRAIHRILTITGWSLGVPLTVVVLAAIVLRCFGLLIPYRIPTTTMHPTIRRGDQVFMEGVTYLRRPPARGDLMVFRTKGIALLEVDEIYVKRLVGLPGDKIRIGGGQLFVNDQPVTYTGPDNLPIRYVNAGFLSQPTDKFQVPPDGFFVLGDNSANSLDSRYWGLVPKANVRGKIWFRYWPWR